MWWRKLKYLFLGGTYTPPPVTIGGISGVSGSIAFKPWLGKLALAIVIVLAAPAILWVVCKEGLLACTGADEFSKQTLWQQYLILLADYAVIVVKRIISAEGDLGFRVPVPSAKAWQFTFSASSLVAAALCVWLLAKAVTAFFANLNNLSKIGGPP